MNEKIRRDRKGRFVTSPIVSNGNDVGIGSAADSASSELPPVKEPVSAAVSENTAIIAEPQ